MLKLQSIIRELCRSVMCRHGFIQGCRCNGRFIPPIDAGGHCATIHL